VKQYFTALTPLVYDRSPSLVQDWPRPYYIFMPYSHYRNNTY